MHAMRPPQLSAAIRTRRAVFLHLPFGPYQPLTAESAAALSTLDPTAAIPRLPVSHVTRLHPNPFAASNPGRDAVTSALARTSALGHTRRKPAAPRAAPVATLTSAALHVMLLPCEQSTPTTTPASAATLLARLPLHAVCSVAAAGEWLEVVYSMPAGHSIGAACDAVVLPAPPTAEVPPTAGGETGSLGISGLAESGSPTGELTTQGRLLDASGGASSRTLSPRAQQHTDAPPQGFGLPFRILRVRCESEAGAAELRAAVALQLMARAETLRRRTLAARRPAAASEGE